MSSVTPRGDGSSSHGGVGVKGGADAEGGGPSSSGGVDLTGFTMFVDRM
jgi:hypothetical protein